MEDNKITKAITESQHVKSALRSPSKNVDDCGLAGKMGFKLPRKLKQIIITSQAFCSPNDIPSHPRPGTNQGKSSTVLQRMRDSGCVFVGDVPRLGNGDDVQNGNRRQYILPSTVIIPGPNTEFIKWCISPVLGKR